MAGYEMLWKSPAGDVFDIALAETSTSGFWAKSLDGFSSEVDVSTELRPTGVGEDSESFSIPSVEGEIDILISPRTVGSMLTVPEAWSQFVRGFSQLRPGTLTVSQPDGQILSAPWRLSKPIPTPERNPHSKRIPFLETQISLVSSAGVWSGMRDVGVETATGARRVLNAGDIPAYVDVEFTHGTVAINGAAPVTLPTVPTRRRLSTDPGSGYKITDPVTGRVDVDAWSSMRGRPIPGRVEPGQMALIETTGDVEVSLTPRFTTPWR
ncbi:MAG: hypothetical protein ACI38U_03130 [Corynebacterium sp.]|uniref:hypothetical protein n=1 Tax=Corynebacterium sp. TaxID=1720 RepID=UPI003EFEBA43